MTDSAYNEALRPQLHFTAKTGWLNDPNGCVFYDGQYHLFFQHNPFGTSWGNMTWGHAVSPDLVHWTQMENAIEPDELGTIFSGSAVVDVNNTSGFGGGDHKPIVAAFTYAGEDGVPFTQAIAYSDDGGKTMTKFDGNPVLGNFTGEGDRDPKLLWHEPTGKWVMVLYLDEPEKQRLAFFTSPNLKEWTKVSELPNFFECPDMFELPVDGDPANTRWVLHGADGHYMLGQFDGETFTPDTKAKRPMETGGTFYAAQSFNGIPASDGRRIQIGWMAGGVYPDMPFNQQMSFPCELTLKTSGDWITVCRWPVEEIKSLYVGEPMEYGNIPLLLGADPLDDVDGDMFDIEMTFRPGSASEVTLCLNGRTINYISDSEYVSFGKAKAWLPAEDGRVTLRLLIDRTSVEIFAQQGRISMSTTFVPGEQDTPLQLFARGGEATLESMTIQKLRSAWT
jgi:fructan beta-fructosidase